MAEQTDRRQAVSEAEKAWEKAPVHIKAMAGAYVCPLLRAIRALSDEIDSIKETKHG